MKRLWDWYRMSELDDKPPPKRLPRHYWPILVVTLLTVMLVGSLIGAALGVNPYTAASLTGCGFVLRESYVLKRKGY